jgi:hypothetical protein
MIRASWLLFSRQYPKEHIENMIWNIKPEIGRNILKDSAEILANPPCNFPVTATMM